MSRLRLFRPEGSPSSDAPRTLSFSFYAPLIRAQRALAKSRGQQTAVHPIVRTITTVPGPMAVICPDGQRLPVRSAPSLFVRRFDLASE
ncbi:MAG: hypothetical protein DWH91_16510 [Planctomycetota bacterium]|nr:MAG: hypothetical protein DWH91_16510 [Planctomycetota bacterium]